MVTQSGLAEIVGAGNVSADPATLDAYAADTELRRQDDVPSSSSKSTAGRPSRSWSTWPRRRGTPLVPVSSGGPHFYGDTVPSTGDAVIVDLSGMKKVDLIEP